LLALDVTKKERRLSSWSTECYPGSSTTKCNFRLVKLVRVREITLKPLVPTRARLGNAVTGIMLRESTTATAMAMAAAVVSSHPRDPSVAWWRHGSCTIGRHAAWALSLSIVLLHLRDDLRDKYLSLGVFAWLTNVCAPLIIVFATDQAGEIGAAAPILLSFSLPLPGFHESLRYSRRTEMSLSRGTL